MKEYDVSSLMNDEKLQKDKKYILQGIKQDCSLSLLYAHSSLKANREIVMASVKKHGHTLSYADPSLWKDRGLVLEAIKQNYGQILEIADETLKRDRRIVLAAIKQDGTALQFADNSFKNDRNIVLMAIKQKGSAFSHADSSFKKDRAFVLEAVKLNGEALPYIDASFKQDIEIVREAIKQNGCALRLADSSFRSDRQFILEAVKQNGLAYITIAEKLKKEIELNAIKQDGVKLSDISMNIDREIVIQAIRNGLPFKNTNHSLFKNREIVLEATKKNVKALDFIDDSLKYNTDFILEAIESNGEALRLFTNFAFSNFEQTRDIVLKAVKQNGYALDYANESFKRDRELVLEAIKQNGYALRYADDSLRKDRKFVLEAVKLNGDVISTDESFKKDKQIALAAVKQNGNTLEQVDESLRRDKQIVMEAVKQNGEVLRYADDSLRKDRKIVLEAVKQNSTAFYYADETLTKDREIVLEALKQDGELYLFIDESLLQDRDIILEAVKQTPTAIDFIDTHLLSDTTFFHLLTKTNPTRANQINSLLFNFIEKSNDPMTTKLSKDIVGMYSNKYCDESYLFYCLDLHETFPKPILKLFSAKYSADFITKLIILQIVKNIVSKHPFTKASTFESVDYHLFCLLLTRFLEENESEIIPTPISNLRKQVDSISSIFETSYYSAKDVEMILYFFSRWTENSSSFDNYKKTLTKYNELFGDSSKIIKIIDQYYSFFNKKFHLLSVLGYGGEGVAFKGFDRIRKELVAVKVKFDKEFDQKSSLERVQFIKRNDIEGKIICYECELIDNYMYSVMELGEETLLDYINRNVTLYQNSANITREKLIEFLSIFIKILDSVKSIHDHNISHRDLDPKNIVKVKDKYKIIDFDTAKVIKTGHSITIARGKASYMPPEVSYDNYSDELLKQNDDEKLAQNVGKITVQCDLFSLGCILLKILTNCSLQLDQQFISDSEIKKYDENYQYFTGYGKHFFSVVTTVEGETKLHYAIDKLINRTIDSSFNVNTLLIRFIITMIQRDSSKRLNCWTHKTILSDIVQHLQGKNITIKDIETSMKEYRTVAPLKSYNQILEENTQTMNEKSQIIEENYQLLQRIKELELQVKLNKQ
ncbi:predicted protein [Naegleria gruberi]|uniref:Predicted protein n=1 Tax=Naegleria gruberi TaxID=5762 RepID=D2VFM9_NAEGR|nr:uncharacterized protein NAEGRDRAFT_49148 [Naegleria gruberi]EFC44500.1 predicted protein [Naegleria gruberi]|eukprot:XP_002677244.1 predicted protein [Naegleria gruberi strain NEG-M]